MFSEYRTLNQLRMSKCRKSNSVYFISNIDDQSCVHVQRICNVKFSTDIKRRNL